MTDLITKAGTGPGLSRFVARMSWLQNQGTER